MSDPDFLLSAAGVQMPRLIYGTAWKKQQTAGLVTQALNLGFRGIDTACQPKHYHEAGVGAGLAACLKQGLSRSQIYLQSKFTPLDGQDPLQVPYSPQASLSEQVLQSFQTSLENLGTDYLDGLLLHSPLADPHQLMEVWQAMEQIYASGAVKQLGISNCYAVTQFKTLYAKARVKPALIQNRFYARTGYDWELREFCRDRQIVYQSFWTLTANPQVLAHASLQALALNYQRSPAQLFFRYLSQIGIQPLTGTSSAEHMRADLAIFDFSLSRAECAAISSVLQAMPTGA